MNPQTLQYLKQDEVGKVIAKGLASLYTNKPEKPVKYLAEWLFNYSSNRQQMQKLLEKQKVREASLNIYQQSIKIKQLKQSQQIKAQTTLQQKIDQFKKSISQHQYQFQLLQELLPQFIEDHTNITGAYIGQLNHPKKQVTQQDNSQTAHLDETVQKLINYIGSSISHKQLMRGKTLSLNKGVTSKAFTLDQEAPPAEEGQQEKAAVKQKYIYIPNVVKNEAMHYFRIPKFGAYLAVPLIYESYLSEAIFDSALEAKNKYYLELSQFLQKQKEDVSQLTTDKEQIEKKINELKQKNAQQSVLEPQIAQLAKIEEELRSRQAQKFEEVPPELEVSKPKFVVCVDNLGKDQELSSKDISFIQELVEHFKVSWTNKQKQLLNRDVATHIQLIKSLPENIQTLYQNINKQCEQIEQQKAQEINQIEDQTLKQYKKEQYYVNRLKDYVKKNQFFLNAFLKLKDFRIIKYRNVLQNILYFLGNSKAEINQPGKAVLNWKNVKNAYITSQSFNKILEYTIQGPKQGEFKPYAKTPVLHELFQGYDQQAIFMYNAGLGAIVKYIKSALAHRIKNVELRKSQKQKERNERQQILAQNQKIAGEKAKELEKEKESIPPQQLQKFNQEQWSAKYDETTPPKQVPAQVVDDIDNDM